jgi:acyl-CoA synthetase (AMP-forming)/AMP-acid ligase II
MISHRNVISNVCQFRAFDGDSLKPGVDKLIGQLPMYHIYGLILLVHIATYSKVTTVILPRFELPLFLDTVDKYKITVMVTTKLMLSDR